MIEAEAKTVLGDAVRPSCPRFEGMKIFAATKARDRDRLGETITGWMNKNPGLAVVDYRVSQSSDSEFHCVTVTLLYRVLNKSAAIRE